jgi:hypothetical protein
MKKDLKNFGLKISTGFFLLQVVITLTILIMFQRTFSNTFTIGDFRSQYTAALMVKNGQIHDLYNLTSQYQAQKIIIPRLSAKSLLPFISAPPLALLLAPLAYLSFNNAYFIFGLIQLAFLVVTIKILHSFLAEEVEHSRKLLIETDDLYLIAAGFLPLWIGIVLGQLSALWMLVIVISWRLSSSHKIGSGLVYSLFFLKPHLLFVPVIFFLAKREWKIVAGILTGSFILLCISLAMMGPHSLLDYASLLKILPFMDTRYGIKSTQQPTLLGVLAVLLTHNVRGLPNLPPYIILIWIIFAITAICFSVRVWTKKQTNKLSNTRWEWALMIFVTVFTSAHTHYYDLSLLYVSSALLVTNFARSLPKITLSRLRLKIYRLFVLSFSIILSIFTAVFSIIGLFIYLLIFLMIYKQHNLLTSRRL